MRGNGRFLHEVTAIWSRDGGESSVFFASWISLFGEFVSFFFFFYFSFSLSFFRYVFCRFIESFARESRSCYALDAFFSFSLFCFFPLLFRFSLPFFYYSDVELRWKFSSFVHRRAGFSEFSSRAITVLLCMRYARGFRACFLCLHEPAAVQIVPRGRALIFKKSSVKNYKKTVVFVV